MHAVSLAATVLASSNREPAYVEATLEGSRSVLGRRRAVPDDDQRPRRSLPCRRRSALAGRGGRDRSRGGPRHHLPHGAADGPGEQRAAGDREQPERGEPGVDRRSEEHTSELQSRENLVCRLLLETKKK